MDHPVLTPPQRVFCTSCDTPNPDSAAYCVQCGSPLVQPGQPVLPIAPARPVAPPPAAPAPVAGRCGSCGIANPAGALYCVNCGSALAGGRAAARPSGYVPRGPALALAGQAGGGTIVQHIYVGVPTAAPEIPLLVRALWFVFVGLWAGQVWLVLAWLLNLTLIGLPLGMWMLNALPQIMTLRRRARPAPPQPARASGASFVVRAVYFVLIGWWVSLLWVELAWLAGATGIGLPLAFLMFERTATVTTLAEV